MRAWAAIWRLRVALVAASVLLLQTVSGAFAADRPVRAALDAFGNPICTSHSGQGEGSGHPGMPGCCTLACSMVAPALADASASGDVRPGPRAIIAWLPSGFASAVPPAASDHDPGQPRAPPLA